MPVPVGAAALVMVVGDGDGDALVPVVGEHGRVGGADDGLAQRLDAVVPVREAPRGGQLPHDAARGVVRLVQALVQEVQAVQLVVARQVRHVPAAALGGQAHGVRRAADEGELGGGEADHAHFVFFAIVLTG